MIVDAGKMPALPGSQEYEKFLLGQMAQHALSSLSSRTVDGQPRQRHNPRRNDFAKISRSLAENKMRIHNSARLERHCALARLTLCHSEERSDEESAFGRRT
jgi:hypothetical protein